LVELQATVVTATSRTTPTANERGRSDDERTNPPLCPWAMLMVGSGLVPATR